MGIADERISRTPILPRRPDAVPFGRYRDENVRIPPLASREKRWDWSIYFRTRRFRQPPRERIQAVGWGCVIWAALSGPFYFWKKGAHIEALLLALISVPTMFADRANSVIDPQLLSQIASLTWGSAALLAPVLLIACYHRRGWDEVVHSL